MKLSIIVPVYNAEKYLEKCINSIFSNNDNTFEVIIINDGSKDKSLKIIKEFMEKYNNIVLIDNSNRGVSYSRNIGIKKSTGDYIMFVDADDELTESWFDEIKDDIDYKNDIIYFSQYDLKSNKNNLLEYIVGCNNNNICIAGPYSKVFKKSVIEENAIYFNEEIINGEDMLFNIEMLNKAKGVKTVKKSIYLYRRYVGQTTKKFDNKIFNSDILFKKSFSNILGQYDILNAEKAKIENYCLQSSILMLFERISYIEEYREAKLYIKQLYDLPYRMSSKKSVQIGKISKIKYFLYKNKFKRALYYFFKLIRIIKFNKNNEEYILI